MNTEMPKSLGREIFEWVMVIVISAALAFALDKFIIVNAKIPSASMEPTIMTGDRLIGNRLAYLNSDPERGDIVIFLYPDNEKELFIKRVIGLPGEWVYIDGSGNIYINDELLEESYGTETILNAGLANTDILLGPDEYFVLGDNRNNSTDSRFEAVGNIKGDDIVGKAWLRVYPFGDFGLVDNIE